MVKTYTIESTDHRAHMSEHEDGRWVSKADYDVLAAELAECKSDLVATEKGHDAAHAACVQYEARIAALEADLAAMTEGDPSWRKLRALTARVAALEVSLKIQDEANAVLMRQVADARRILGPLAECDPEIRRWLRRTDLSAETEEKPDDSDGERGIWRDEQRQ